MRNDFALKKPKPRNVGGRPRNDAHGSAEMNAMSVVLRARCKRMGWRPTEANLRIAKATHLGFEAGIAIHLEAIRTETEFDQDRWAACEDIRRTFHGYWALIGKSPFPQNAAIQILPEETFTDPDARPREEFTEQQKADRFQAIANRKQKLITWISLGAGVPAQQFADVITLEHRAKAGFIQALDRVMEVMK